MAFECYSCSNQVYGNDILPFPLKGKPLCQKCYFKEIEKLKEPLYQEVSRLSRVHSDSTLEIPTLRREYSWNTVLNMLINLFSNSHYKWEKIDDVV